MILNRRLEILGGGIELLFGFNGVDYWVDVFLLFSGPALSQKYWGLDKYINT